MSSTAYAGLVPLRPSRVNIPSSGMRIGANGICYSPGYGSTSTGTHSRAYRARDGWHHRGIDLLRWAYASTGLCRFRRMPEAELPPRPAPGNGPRKRTGRHDCAAGLELRCRLHLRATGLEAARIGQWNRGSDHEGGRGRLLRTKGGNERIVSLFAATMHPGVAWHREPGSPVPAAATGARDTMCER